MNLGKEIQNSQTVQGNQEEIKNKNHFVMFHRINSR